MADSASKLQRALDKAEKKASSVKAQLERIKEENTGAVETATRTATTLGGAFGVAYWMGRNPTRQKILGVDASLVIGGSATVAAMMGWAGDQELIVEGLGTGALSVYAVRKGFEMGKEAHEKAGQQAA